MKHIKPLILMIFLLSLFRTVSAAETDLSQEKGIVGYLPELILRPVGILSSAMGAGFFVATSPFAAIANITEPRDAFEHTYNAFIKTPFRFTFRRPLGDYTIPIDGE